MPVQNSSQYQGSLLSKTHVNDLHITKQVWLPRWLVWHPFQVHVWIGLIYTFHGNFIWQLSGHLCWLAEVKASVTLVLVEPHLDVVNNMLRSGFGTTRECMLMSRWSWGRHEQMPGMILRHKQWQAWANGGHEQMGMSKWVLHVTQLLHVAARYLRVASALPSRDVLVHIRKSVAFHNASWYAAPRMPQQGELLVYFAYIQRQDYAPNILYTMACAASHFVLCAWQHYT